MPRIKQSKDAIFEAKLRKAISGSAAYYSMGVDEQAFAAGVTRSTWYRRLKQPNTFTLYELRRMIRRFHWDNETIIDFLR
jgi:hypothetical protein